jgi:hypothetical protein
VNPFALWLKVGVVTIVALSVGMEATDSPFSFLPAAVRFPLWRILHFSLMNLACLVSEPGRFLRAQILLIYFGVEISETSVNSKAYRSPLALGNLTTALWEPTIAARGVSGRRCCAYSAMSLLRKACV